MGLIMCYQIAVLPISGIISFLYLRYSEKIWWALNLAISAQNAVFWNLVSFKFGNSVPQPKDDVTTMT